jgi:hypothetical protein
MLCLCWCWGPRTPANLRLVKHTDKFRLEVYWTRTQVGVRRKADGKNMFLVNGVSNLKVGILLANEAVSCLEFDWAQLPSCLFFLLRSQKLLHVCTCV